MIDRLKQKTAKNAGMGDSPHEQRRQRMFVLAGGGLVVLVVILAFTIIDSPITAGKRAQDARRIADLRELARCVQHQARLDGQLVENIGALKQSLENSLNPPCNSSHQFFNDPYTAKPYDYARLDTDSYRLCGEFELDSREDIQRGSNGLLQGDVRYKQGYHCFDIDIRNINPRAAKPADALTIEE